MTITNDIDLKTYELDGMRISEILDNTSKITKYNEYTQKIESFDKYRYNLLKEKHKIQNINNPRRWKYKQLSYEEWEENLILKGILTKEVIDNNLNRCGFLKDRTFIKDGKIYEDEWFSTLMLGFSKILEEDSTISFFRNNYRIRAVGNLSFNPISTDFNSNKPVNGHPDFIFVFNEDWDPLGIEQKCVYKDNFSIKIRESQIAIFKQYKNMYILVKQENYLDKDIYYFYNFYKIKDLLHKEKQQNGRISYTITKEELDNLNIEYRKLVDDYVAHSEIIEEIELKKSIYIPF